MKTPDDVLNDKLDRITGLLQHLLAIELAKGGVNKTEIGKHLKIAKSSVVRMLRGFGGE